MGAEGSRPKRREQYTVEVSPPKPGESGTRRFWKFPDKLVEYEDENIRTIYGLHEKRIRESPDSICLACRGPSQGDKLGAFIPMTFEQFGKRRTDFGSGLCALGVKENEMVGFYMRTRVEWVISDLACMSYSLVSVPLYDTLGPDAAGQIIEHAECTCAIADPKNVERLLEISKTVPGIRFIVQSVDEIDEKTAKAAEGIGIKLYSFAEVEAMGREKPVEHIKPNPDTVFTIIYTSGSTGVPKGAVHNHRGIVAGDACLPPQGLDFHPGDNYVSFLPLAHVFERLVTHILLSKGCAIYYFNGDLTRLLDDFQTVKPTVIVGVPRVFERIKQRTLTKLEGSGGIQKMLISAAMNSKKWALENEKPYNSIYESLVFSKTRAAVGGRARIVLSGSAPLDPVTNDFLRIMFFGTNLLEGYGLTETFALFTLQCPGDTKTGCIGPPFGCLEVKLLDCPELNYLSTDKPHARGEICSRGVMNMVGYHKAPELTAEVLTEDGWFKTGDIGQFLPDGTLQIIDRKKNIFKLSQGEYVAVEYVEAVCARCPLVAQCWVYGSSLKPFLIAVVVPSEKAVAEAKTRGMDVSKGLEGLCQDKRFEALVWKELTLHCRGQKLPGFQVPKALVLEPLEFSIDRGHLTPSMKFRRPTMFEMYQKELDAVYAREKDVLARAKKLDSATSDDASGLSKGKTKVGEGKGKGKVAAFEEAAAENEEEKKEGVAEEKPVDDATGEEGEIEEGKREEADD